MVLLSDRYELGATIGAGGMARVVQAHDRLLDRAVAVKLMRDDLSADPTVRERFLREARAAARFAHPNAVAVYDTGQDGRRPWIVMELVDGDNLADRLAAEGALPADTAKSIADQVLAALSAAHRAGMVHRDVKPANILLPRDGGVKLTDFGIAKGIQEATAGLTATGQLIGTAKYLSPEQVDGHPATPASDVYAMGVVLYEMLTGAPPFVGENALAVALAHTRDPVPPLRGVDQTLASVAERALAKDPEQRYPDAAAMRDALTGRSASAGVAWPAANPTQAAATTVPLLAAAAPAAGERRRDRSPWLLIAAGVLAVAGLLGLLAFLVGDLGDTPTAGGQRDQEQVRNQRPAASPQPQPSSGDELTEAQATESQETEPPASEPATSEPATEPPLPTTLPELAVLLADSPAGTYGRRQDDLAEGIARLLERPESEQGEEAVELRDDVREWVADGELTPEAGDLALALLEPLAATVDSENGGGGNGDNGNSDNRNSDNRNGDNGNRGGNGGD
ncbi:MAG: protein kinase [Actinomycetota bacterium]|nr:protein kinase [Actinomycetota bacterium]